MKKFIISFALLFVLLSTVSGAAPPVADPLKKEKKTWCARQKAAVETVLRLTRLGTRFPAYRCGVYVPGIGLCYMKMTSVSMPSDPQAAAGGAAPEFVSDVAEVLEVSGKIGKGKVLNDKECLYIQSRFLNRVYLRKLNSDLVRRISVTDRKNLLPLKKMLEEIVTYLDGDLNGEKSDVWISPVTEAFSRSAVPVARISYEGMIVPGKAIVLYRKFPGLFSDKGEKAMAKKLLEVLKQAKSLQKYYGSYRLAVALESGNVLMYADYPVEKAAELKEKDLKYFLYRHGEK